MNVHAELGLVSGAEAAEYLGVSNAAMFTLKRNGVIPSVRLGRKIYYRRQDLLDYVNGNIKFNKPPAQAETSDTEEN